MHYRQILDTLLFHKTCKLFLSEIFENLKRDFYGAHTY